MFTGIIEHLGKVAAVTPTPPGVRIRILAAEMAAGAKLGDSIAVNGCCLTVVHCEGPEFAFDAGPETLSRTNLGGLVPGACVNLESSLRLGDKLGGHFVTGHIDALGTLVERQDDRDWSTFRIAFPPRLRGQLASKGSIAVDGVSLTLVEITDDRFSVALIPHTLSVTTLGPLRPGDRVNLETDLLAKYVESQLAARSQRGL